MKALSALKCQYINKVTLIYGELLSILISYMLPYLFKLLLCLLSLHLPTLLIPFQRWLILWNPFCSYFFFLFTLFASTFMDCFTPWCGVAHTFEACFECSFKSFLYGTRYQLEFKTFIFWLFNITYIKLKKIGPRKTTHLFINTNHFWQTVVFT